MVRKLLSNFLNKVKQLSYWLGEKYRLADQPMFSEIELRFRLLGHMAISNGLVTTLHSTRMMTETKLLHLSDIQIQQAIKAFQAGQQMLTDHFEASLRYSKLDDLGKEMLLKSCWRMIWVDSHLALREYQLIHLWGYWLGWSRSAIERLGELFKPVYITLDHQQALNLLDITLDTPPDIIKQMYKRKLSHYHPDKIMGEGGSLAEINKANEKIAKLQEAYALIRMFHYF